MAAPPSGEEGKERRAAHRRQENRSNPRAQDDQVSSGPVVPSARTVMALPVHAMQDAKFIPELRRVVWPGKFRQDIPQK